MTTIRKLALATTVAAGLLVSTSALAGDISSDRYSKQSQPQRHPAAVAVAAPAQETKAEQVRAATATIATAHACTCAHKS